LEKQYNLTVKLVKSSFNAGEDVEIIIENLEINPNSTISINLNKVEEDYTEFAYSAGKIIQSSGKSLRVSIPYSTDLKNGMYLIGSINVVDETSDGFPNIISITPDKFGDILMEVTNPDDKEKTEEELSKLYAEILQDREIDFNKGIGNGSKSYGVVLFTRNCKITQRMRLGQYELLPWEGLECNDKLDSLQSFLVQNGLNLLENTEDTLNKCKMINPPP